MDSSLLIAFAGAMLLLATSPGPGVFAVTATALACGTRAAMATVLGIIAGDIIYLSFALTGLAAIAAALGEWFWVVRLAGGGWLIWTGLGILFFRKQGVPRSVPHRRRFLSGLTLTLANPKVILFYGGLVPAFLGNSPLNLTTALVLTAIVAAVLFSVLSCYALLSGMAAARLRHPSLHGYINRFSGCTLIGVGIAVATRE